MDNYTTGTTTDLGERLQALREKKGWTRRRLAAESGVNERTISHLERGQHGPSLFTAVLLADALGVSLDSLAKGRGKR